MEDIGWPCVVDADTRGITSELHEAPVIPPAAAQMRRELDESNWTAPTSKYRTTSRIDPHIEGFSTSNQMWVHKYLRKGRRKLLNISPLDWESLVN